MGLSILLTLGWPSVSRLCLCLAQLIAPLTSLFNLHQLSARRLIKLIPCSCFLRYDSETFWCLDTSGKQVSRAAANVWWPDDIMSSRRFGYAATLPAVDSSYTATTTMISSKIPMSRSTGYLGGHMGQVDPRSHIPMPPPTAFSRARKNSSASESEDVSRFRKTPSREPSPAVGSGKSRPAGVLYSNPASAKQSKETLPQQSVESLTSSAFWKSRKTPQPEARQRNVLRRKAPSIEQYTERSRGRSQSSSATKFNKLDAHRTNAQAQVDIDGSGSTPSRALNNPQPQYQRISPAPAPQPPIEPETISAESQSRSRIPKEFIGLSTTINTCNLPPPTPNFTGGSSPSTRYSDSPGPWSTNSRTSTPTSLSSYSPGIIQPTKAGSRLRQPSPSLSRTHQARQHAGGTNSVDDSKNIAPMKSRLPPRSQTEPIPQLSSVSPEIKDARRYLTVSPPLHTPSPQISLASSASQQGQYMEHQCQEAPSMSPPPVASPPPRPSREGTHDLGLGSSPIVKSNLPTSRLPTHRRRGSSEARSNSRMPVYQGSSMNASAESVQSKASYRAPQPTPSPSQFNARSESRSRATTPTTGIPARRKSVLVKEPKESNDIKDTKTQSNTTTASRGRFGVFSKKHKPATETKQHESAEKQRRCPTAGTGHEGYGKYSQRGRRPSVSSSAGRTRSTSTNRSVGYSSETSVRTGLDIDDFLLDRLEPVVINGGGSGSSGANDTATLYRTQSEQSASGVSVTSSTSDVHSPQKDNAGLSSESLLASAGYLVQSPVSIESNSRRSPFSSATSKNMKSTMNRRGSLRNSKIIGNEKELNQKTSKTKPVTPGRPSRDAQNDNSTSKPQLSSAPSDQKKKKPEKSGRWNFFQRSNQASRKTETHKDESESTTTVREMPVAISKVPTSRPVAHYAMVDNEQVGPGDLEEILQSEDSPMADEDEPGAAAQGLGLKKKQHGHSILLPAPPVGLNSYPTSNSPSSPKVFFNKNPEPQATTVKRQPSKPSRLASVGRIPRVVPREAPRHVSPPPLRSFSRPFSMGEGPSLTATAADSTVNQRNYPGQNIPSGLGFTPISQELAGRPSEPIPHNLSGKLASGSLSQQEFLSFSPRKGSNSSGSISSESQRNLAAITAVVPHPGSTLMDDEVWQEYDEFIDKVASPELQSEEFASSPNLSFRMAKKASQILQAGLDGTDNTRASLNSARSSTQHLALLNAIKNVDSIHLSRSMILSGLNPSSLTSSPHMSHSEFASSRPEQGPDSSNPPAAQLSPQTVPQGQKLNYEGLRRSDGSRCRNDKAEQNSNAPMEQANIRSGSLMASRWLSFGRVLFSPAHNHVQSQDQTRILAIDGLGNDDWSFYCALTYPTATVYSFSAVPIPDSAPRNPAAWDPPPNHRTIHHSITENPFPFPKGFFTAAVVRFPSACSEPGLRNIISECNRVLRTGGYLELSVMDMDMVNMGSRTRKAIRLLKERIYMTDPSICLKPTGDNLQRIMGERGFANLNRCTVVVPVAGTIVQSSDTSSSNQSVAPSSQKFSGHPSNPRSSTGGANRSHKKAPSDDVNVFLGDLLSDPSPSASNDESISKMVAKVARWWHARCYEAPLFPNDNPADSVWSDRRVLRECRRRGTGFKLLIAYAQKPSETRRTASV